MTASLVPHKNYRLPGIGKISQIDIFNGRYITAGEYFGYADIRASDPVRACEVCGQEGASSDMVNLMVTIGSPGRHDIPPFQHPEEEHWACSLKCWRELGNRVLDEMQELLASKQAAIGMPAVVVTEEYDAEPKRYLS